MIFVVTALRTSNLTAEHILWNNKLYRSNGQQFFSLISSCFIVPKNLMSDPFKKKLQFLQLVT